MTEYKLIKMNFYQVLLSELWSKSKGSVIPQATTSDVLNVATKIYTYDPAELDEYFFGSIYMINAVRDKFNNNLPQHKISEDEFNKLFWDLGNLNLPDIIVDIDGDFG